jgi:D-xylose reductase
VTAFSPLGAPSYIPLGTDTAADSVLSHPTVTAIAREVGRTPALDQNRRFNDPGEFCEKAFGTFFPIYE